MSNKALHSDKPPDLPPDLDRLFRQAPDAEHEEMRRLWQHLRRAQDAERATLDAEAAWAAFAQEHFADDATGSETPATGRVADRAGAADRAPRAPGRAQRLVRYGWAVAAVVGALVLGVVVYGQVPASVTAPPGQTATATLPDGSTVELSSGATISHARGFRAWPFVAAAERTVRLDGQAFFDVETGPRAFVVQTFNAHIRVLGTQFNVDARRHLRTGETRVTLLSGRVRLEAAADPSQAVVLAPGESSVVTAARGPAPPRPSDPARALAWRSGGFAVSEAPLGAILTDLEQRFGVRLTLSAPAVRDHSMSLFYARNVQLEDVLRDICTALDLSYRPTSRGYELLPRSSAPEPSSR